MADKLSSTYSDLVHLAQAKMSSYKITNEEIQNLEQATQLQSKCRLWSAHRAGRITASNFKSAVRTDPCKPSVSLVKKICYPQQHVFSNSATRWGCEHEATTVEEFLDWFAVEHSDCSFSNSGFIINSEFLFLGASPDGIVCCSCHGRYLLEVKCPYRCCDKGLHEAVKDRSFFLKENDDGTLALDTLHAYYYQVQCQLGISEAEKCFFVVWAQESVHIEEIKVDIPFFQANVLKANHLIETAVLPEIIGCWFTRPRENTVIANQEETADVVTNTDEATYCYCKGKDDGSKMICCENENCSSGQWFHFKCVNLRRAPRGQWFCKECSNA